MDPRKISDEELDRLLAEFQVKLMPLVAQSPSGAHVLTAIRAVLVASRDIVKKMKID